MGKPLEKCDCACHQEREGEHGATCPECVNWHIVVLRHTVAKLLGNWHLPAVVAEGGLMNQKDKFGKLPGWRGGFTE